MPVVVLWFVMALAAIPWAMARARNQGYPMGPWCVLALVFGLLAVAAAYLLPKKDRDESLGEAAARSVTVGAISAGKAIRAAANEHAPGLAVGTGRGGTNAAFNVGSGAKQAINDRRGALLEGERPRRTVAWSTGSGVARAAREFRAGVGDAREPATQTGAASR
jgi:hypothetical protein